MRLLHLPAFLSAVFILYWSLAVGAITGMMRVFKVWGGRNDALDWSTMLVKLFGIQIYKLGSSSCYRGGACLYVANHRSWADFFLDSYISEGRAQLMSRFMVFLVFPMFMMGVVIIKGVVLFKRMGIADKVRFNEWLDYKLESSPMAGLVVFPEGHRNHKSKSLTLKRGMLQYAYSRRLPVQIMMTSHKEDVLSEKHLSAKFGTSLITRYSEPILTSDYEQFDDFMGALQREWDHSWEHVYGAGTEGLDLLVVEGDNYDYPLNMRLAMVVMSVVAITAMIAFLAISLYLVYNTLTLLGSWQWLGAVAVVLWVVASFSISYQAGRAQSRRVQGRQKVE